MNDRIIKGMDIGCHIISTKGITHDADGKINVPIPANTTGVVEDVNLDSRRLSVRFNTRPDRIHVLTSDVIAPDPHHKAYGPHKHGPTGVRIEIAFTDGTRSAPGREAPIEFRHHVIERAHDETQEAFAARVHDYLMPWGGADKLLKDSERVAQFHVGRTVTTLNDIYNDWRGALIKHMVPKGKRGIVTDVGPNHVCVDFETHFQNLRVNPDDIKPTDAIIDDPRKPEVYRLGQAVRARRLLDHLDSAGTLAEPLPKHTRGTVEHVHDDGILVAFRKPGADGNVLRYRVDPDDIEPIKMMQDAAPTFRVNQAVRAAKDILHNARGEEMIHHIDKGWHGSVVHIAPKFVRVDWAARCLGLLDILPEDIEPLDMPWAPKSPEPSPPPETYLHDHPPPATPKALMTYAEGDAIFLNSDVSHDYEGQPIDSTRKLRAGTSGFIEQVALEGPAAPRIGVKLPSVHPHHVFQLNPVCIGRMEPPRGQKDPRDAEADRAAPEGMAKQEERYSTVRPTPLMQRFMAQSEAGAAGYAFEPGNKVLAQRKLVCDADANPLPHPVEKSNRGVVSEIHVVDGKLALVRVGWLGSTSRRMYWHEPGDLRLEPVLGPKEGTSVTRLGVPREPTFTEHLRGLMSSGLQTGLTATPDRRSVAGRIVPSMAETEVLVSFALQAMTGARIKVDTFEHGGANALMVAGEVPALADHIDQLAHRLELLAGYNQKLRAAITSARVCLDPLLLLDAPSVPAPWAEGDKVVAVEAIIHDINSTKLRSAIPKEHTGVVARIDDDQRALVVTFDPIVKDGASLYVKVPVAWVRRA